MRLDSQSARPNPDVYIFASLPRCSLDRNKSPVNNEGSRSPDCQCGCRIRAWARGGWWEGAVAARGEVFDLSAPGGDLSLQFPHW